MKARASTSKIVGHPKMDLLGLADCAGGRLCSSYWPEVSITGCQHRLEARKERDRGCRRRHRSRRKGFPPKSKTPEVHSFPPKSKTPEAYRFPTHPSNPRPASRSRFLIFSAHFNIIFSLPTFSFLDVVLGCRRQLTSLSCDLIFT